MGGAVVSRLIVLTCGTLYPAYASYKAVKSANVRQYVRWMMYWIIYALFITVETFTDILLSWVPFYYEIKVGFIIWLLSPYTKGAAFLYRKFVHPYLSKKEPEIDSFLMSAKERSYETVLNYGSRGINVATTAFVTAAVRGHVAVSDRLKSFSVNDISQLSDDTPVHSMNPLSYNPPVQSEVHRRSPNAQAFDGPSSRRPLQPQRQSSEQEDLDMGSFEMINPEVPSGGLVMHRITPSSDSYQPTQFTSSGGDNAQPHTHIGSQFKAYSMMNLSNAAEPEPQSTIMTRTIEFSTAPPEISVDDSVIPDNTEHFLTGDPSYSTLPRQRRRKSKKEKDPLLTPSPSLRRSKRTSKPRSYDGSNDNLERY